MIENVRHATRIVFPMVAITLLYVSAVVADEVHPSEVETLRTLVEQQKKLLDRQGERIDSLETRMEGAQQKVAPKTEETLSQPDGKQANQVLREPDNPYQILADDDFPKSIPLFPSDWRFSFGGYVKTDVIVDFSGTDDPYQFIVSGIPVDGAANSPQPGSYTQIHAKETRFNFEMRNVSPDLPFNKAFIEMDLFNYDSPGVRLRHAYFQYGHLIVGQTWTTLTELRALPFLVDFAYGDSLYGGRAMQVRWEQPVNDQFSWAVGIEDWNDGAIDNSAGSLAGTARARLPLLATRGTYDAGQALFTVGGSFSELRWDGDAGVSDETAIQWALVLGARVFLDQDKKHYLGFGGSYGDGSGGTIISLSEGGVPGAVLTPTGSLETQHAWNFSAALHYQLSKRFSSNLSGAWAEVETSPLLGPDAMKSAAAGHINLIFDLNQVMRFGAEYMIGQRVNANDADGIANRIQFMAMFSF